MLIQLPGKRPKESKMFNKLLRIRMEIPYEGEDSTGAVEVSFSFEYGDLEVTYSVWGGKPGEVESFNANLSKAIKEVQEKYL